MLVHVVALYVPLDCYYIGSTESELSVAGRRESTEEPRPTPVKQARLATSSTVPQVGAAAAESAAPTMETRSRYPQRASNQTQSFVDVEGKNRINGVFLIVLLWLN